MGDVGMIERRQRLRFAGEPSQPLRVVRKGIGQNLQRDIATKHDITTMPARIHAYGAERIQRPVKSTGGSERGPGPVKTVAAP